MWRRKVYVGAREYLKFLEIIKIAYYATELNKDYRCRKVTTVQCKHCLATAD